MPNTALEGREAAEPSSWRGGSAGSPRGGHAPTHAHAALARLDGPLDGRRPTNRPAPRANHAIPPLTSGRQSGPKFSLNRSSTCETPLSSGSARVCPSSFAPWTFLAGRVFSGPQAEDPPHSEAPRWTVRTSGPAKGRGPRRQVRWRAPPSQEKTGLPYSGAAVGRPLRASAMLPAMLSAASIAHSPWSGQVPPPRILPRALTGPALRLVALQDECPAGCTRVGPGPVVHGDPMFKINGTGRHFWINSGTLTPLLTWRCVDNITDVVLAGKTTTRPESGDQWFTQLVFSQDGEEVLNLEASEGAETIRAFGRHLNRAGDVRALAARCPALACPAPCGAFSTKSLRSHRFRVPRRHAVPLRGHGALVEGGPCVQDGL